MLVNEESHANCSFSQMQLDQAMDAEYQQVSYCKLMTYQVTPLASTCSNVIPLLTQNSARRSAVPSKTLLAESWVGSGMTLEQVERPWV